MHLLLSLFGPLTLVFFTWRIHQFYKGSQSRLVRYFRDMALLGGIGLSVYALMSVSFALVGTLSAGGSFVLSILHVVGGSLILLSFVCGAAAFFYMTFPDISSEKVLAVGLILTASLIIFRLFFLPLPVPWVDEGGNLRFQIPLLMKVITVLFAAIGLLPLAFACAREALEKKELRVRSGSLALALLLMVMVTVTMYIEDISPEAGEFSSILRTVGFIMLVVAVIFRVKVEDSS